MSKLQRAEVYERVILEDWEGEELDKLIKALQYGDFLIYYADDLSGAKVVRFANLSVFAPTYALIKKIAGVCFSIDAANIKFRPYGLLGMEMYEIAPRKK